MCISRLFVGRKLTLHFYRSYYKVIDLGYMTKDPAAYFDPNVCAKYIKAKPTATPTPTPTPTPSPVPTPTPAATPGKRQHIQKRRKISVSSINTPRPSNSYRRQSEPASRDLDTGNGPRYPLPHTSTIYNSVHT